MQSGNLYAYCMNNPLRYVDPTGRNAAEAAESWIATMWWLSTPDGPFPLFDIIYVGGAAILVGIAAANAPPPRSLPRDADGNPLPAEPSRGDLAANDLVREAKKGEAEHTKGARPSTENKHEQGQARRQRDQGGEKGDARRERNPSRRR